MFGGAGGRVDANWTGGIRCAGALDGDRGRPEAEQRLERRLDAARYHDHRAPGLADHVAGDATEQHRAVRAVPARTEEEQVGTLGLVDQLAHGVPVTKTGSASTCSGMAAIACSSDSCAKRWKTSGGVM